MKYLTLIVVLVATFSYADFDFRGMNLIKLDVYQNYTPVLETKSGLVRPRIMVYSVINDRCFNVIKKVRRHEVQYRNCKFLLKGFPEEFRDENIPKSNIVDFERSDENPETETNRIEHINIKENGDIVFLYERGSGAKTSLYFCTQKLNIEDEGLAENPIPECEFLYEVEYQDDINAHFKPVYIEKIDQFYPAR